MTGGIGFSRDAQAALKTNRANRDRYRDHQSLMGKSLTRSKTKKRPSKKRHSTQQIELASKNIQDYYRAERIKQVVAFLLTTILLIWLILSIF